MTTPLDHLTLCRTCRNSTDDESPSPLIAAAKKSYLTCVKYLIEVRKVDINTRDKEGHSAFFWAVENGDRLMVEYLFAKGALFEVPVTHNRFPANVIRPDQLLAKL